jgi:hypothetical protein
MNYDLSDQTLEAAPALTAGMQWPWAIALPLLTHGTACRFEERGRPRAAGQDNLSFDRRSKPDLRSIPDRLSPTSFFSSSVRVSTPLRRSLPERRPSLARLNFMAMSLISKIASYSGFNSMNRP